MASTSVRYKGRSLHVVPESIVTILGYMIFHEGFTAAQTADEKARFTKMARDFDDRTVGTGCTNLGLDQLLAGDRGNENEFLHLLKLVKRRLAGFGQQVPAEYMEQFVPVPEYRTGCRVSPWFYTLIDSIAALIAGRPVPPVSPDERRRWRRHRKARGRAALWKPVTTPPANFILPEFLEQLRRGASEPKCDFVRVYVRNLSQAERETLVAFVNAMDEHLRSKIEIIEPQ